MVARGSSSNCSESISNLFGLFLGSAGHGRASRARRTVRDGDEEPVASVASQQQCLLVSVCARSEAAIPETHLQILQPVAVVIGATENIDPVPPVFRRELHAAVSNHGGGDT